MGNSSSWGVLNRSSHSKHLAKSKLEDYENVPDLHRIINPKGGGELVDLAWSAHQMKSYNKIDDYIRQEVSKYLLNDGKGEMIPIEEVVFHRNKESKRKSPDDKPLKMPLKIDKDEKSEYKARLVCFDMNKRGKAGETLLHLCFSNGTYLHMLIARRLIQIFPNMINDICVGDELYGQTALHMAVVNEDPYMLNFLLSWGADVNQRACGRFFIPDDQKDRRQNLDKYEYPTLPAKTNYECLSYFGEYPLSFAAILNQEDCVRLLVAYGADMDKQDSNGNTALHMCVINNNVEIFKLLVEHQANLEIKNNQGFTPLTLAAELCREEIFFFILETQREIYWVYANISCAAYPLANVDTISETGSIDTKSVLHLILNKNTEEHLELLEGFLTDLLYKKWYTFVRFRFFVEAFVYMLFFILNAVTLFLKRIYYDHLGDINCTEITLEENHLTEECECAYRDPNDDLKYPRTILELIVLFYTCVLIIIHLNEIYIQRWQFLQTLLPNPTRFLYLLALILILIIVPLRLSCNTYGEDVLVVLIIIFISINTMYYARGFKFITTFVYKFHLILRNNMPRFFLIYFIFLLGFSQTFYLIFTANPPDQEAHVFNSVINSFLHTIVLTVNEVFVEYNRFDYVSSYVIIGGIFIVIYLMIGGLLMINILIAMMDHTQEMTNERTNEWVRQWGKQVLYVEQNVNIKERLKQQKRYAHQMNNGVKALVVRWKQSETERKEAMHNKEVFRENVKNVQAAHKNE